MSMALQASPVFSQEERPVKTPAELARLSLEELADMAITSVSKKSELLSDAAASVYVITGEDIRRSGAQTLPEILRLAPNLQVAQVDASQYAITARGFNSITANKLQVMINERSVYTPLFSGVFWDVQDVLPENIERIEVISGPGGTLWGANAVNGVINIVSRDSKDTQGTLLSLGTGSDQRHAAARFGGKLGENATFRLTAQGFRHTDTADSRGISAEDDWDKKQLGLRLDWVHANDALLMNANFYDGAINQKLLDEKSISGRNLLTRWRRKLGDESSLQLQAYYDKTKRVYPGTFGDELETYDVDVQHRFAIGTRHDIVWGGGYRLSRDDVSNGPVLAFFPAQRDLTLANIFVQDSMALNDHWQLTLGGKLERNNYTGLEFQPNARLAWKLPNHALLWSAISRSVRTPARIDTDLFSPATPPFLLAGGPNFQAEKQTSYEVGYRSPPNALSSFSASVFYNDFDHLRSIETAGGLPFTLANTLEAHSYGVEMWGSYRLLDWWRINLGYNYLKLNLNRAPGSLDTTSLSAGTDPMHQFSLRSSMNLSSSLELDLSLRAISALANPSVPGYATLDARLGWALSKDLDLSFSAVNVFDHQHAEFGSVPGRSEFGRSFFMKLVWKY